MESRATDVAGTFHLGDLPAALPRLSLEERLPKEVLQASSHCYSLIGRPGVCGPKCPSRIASFSVNFRRFGAEDRRYAVTDSTVLVDDTPHVVSAITMPLATLRIVPDAGDGAENMPRSARKAARKARRLGYRYEAVDPQRHLDGIFAIRTSMKVRQGQPVPDYYFERPVRILDLDGYCERHTSGFYGIFKGETLAAYCTVRFFGEIAQLNHILGHKDHLQDGVMDLLVEEASRAIGRERPWVRGLNYLYASGSPGLVDFKANTGFVPQHTSFTTAPPGIARRIEAELSRERQRPEEGNRGAAPKPPALARIPKMFSGARRQPDGWSEPSGIHSVLRALALPAASRVLCVGAGAGETLAYSALLAVVKKGYRPIVAEWRSPQLIAKVGSDLGDRCTLYARDWKEIEFADPFDLAIFDLPYMGFMAILMKEFRSASKLVNVGGFLIVKFYYDIDAGMKPEDRESLGRLYVRRFKSTRPSLADIADAFRGSDFHVHGLVDRANERAASKNIGWLVLRKVRPG